ncbi:MAG: hypothetical protein DME05_23635, partial [Candidatus Rokuibacteriota bacterium]
MMPAPMFGRVAAVLAPLVTFLVTFLVAQQLPMLTRALGQSVPPTQVVRRELRIGAPGVPSALDPGAALEGTSPLIARQVFDTLVAWREGSTEVEPALATRWNVSRDGLVWSFSLREGVKFHDGSPLTALEVAASFERQLRPETQGANKTWPALLRGAPGVVRAVRALNARTVEIVLVQPYAPLLTVLAHPGLAIAKPSQAADAPGRLIGTGPYRVVDASVGRLALEAMPGYWAGIPKSERLVFLDVSADDQAESELDSRSLDIWFPAGPPRRAEGALSTPGLRIGYLAFQTEKEPFSRRTLRQAVAAALDPAILGQTLERAAVPLQSFLPPGVWGRREGSPILGGSRTTVKALIKESKAGRNHPAPAGLRRPAVQYSGRAGGDRTLAHAGRCLRHGAGGGDGRRGRSPPPPVPALGQRSGDQGPARAELLLLSKSAAGRRADPGESAFLPLRAPASLPARAGHAGRGAAVAADLRAPAMGCGALRRQGP